jgi:predicted alpha/beta-hydrolase family hydrolase
MSRPGLTVLEVIGRPFAARAADGVAISALSSALGSAAARSRACPERAAAALAARTGHAARWRSRTQRGRRAGRSRPPRPKRTQRRAFRRHVAAAAR